MLLCCLPPTSFCSLPFTLSLLLAVCFTNSFRTKSTAIGGHPPDYPEHTSSAEKMLSHTAPSPVTVLTAAAKWMSSFSHCHSVFLPCSVRDGVGLLSGEMTQTFISDSSESLAILPAFLFCFALFYIFTDSPFKSVLLKQWVYWDFLKTHE